MIIDDKDIRVNVLILSMDDEIDVLIQTIETLAISIEDNVTVSILLNGGSSQRLRDLFAKVPYICYYEVPENLGVAGGRNFLLETEECKASDVICIIDNDVIVPNDYLRSVVTALMSDEKLGVVGANVMNVKYYSDRFAAYVTHEGIFGNRVCEVSSEEVKNIFLANPSSSGLYHSGSYRGWFLAYLSPLPFLLPPVNSLLEMIGIRTRFGTHLRDSTGYLKKLAGGQDKFVVSSVAGCTQSFRREIINQVGGFDNRFNPYGLEDVDLNIRVMKAGYTNVTLGGVWLLHGTDSRHTERDAQKMTENFFRVLTIFAFKHTSRFLYRIHILLRIHVNRLRPFVGNSVSFKAQMVGYRKGLSQVKGSRDVGVF